METKELPLTALKVNRANPRVVRDGRFKRLVDSILVFPEMLTDARPIIIDADGTVLGGNQRFRALQQIASMDENETLKRLTAVPDYQQRRNEAEQQKLIDYWTQWKDHPTAKVIDASALTDQQKQELVIKDNTQAGEWDYDMLANEWDTSELPEWGLDVWQDHRADDDEEDDAITEAEAHSSLSERFVVPPFSVLDTRQGYWRDRKEYWRMLIKDYGESRGKTLFKNAMLRFPQLYAKTKEERERLGISFEEYIQQYISEEELQRMQKSRFALGVSLLDPVLAEIICRWFGVENGRAFDCFAGDTVFGYVSAYLGNEFTGIELREEQARLNNERTAGMNARYICDDGQNVTAHLEPESQDLLFSCPPYFDLEQYSDLPNDASNQETYEDFMKIIDNAFTGAIKCLKTNRFAVIVISDIREPRGGGYYDMCGDIKRIFKRNGLCLYNELILLNNVGSHGLRVSSCMKNRKIVKIHQNVLVFYKGNTDAIKENFKIIEYEGKDLESFGVDTADGCGDAEDDL